MLTKAVTVSLCLSFLPCSTCPKESGMGRPLAGVVVDTTGKPLGGAEVWLTTAGMDGGPTTLARTTTDAEGRFRVHVPNWWFQMSRNLRQELGLVVAKRGYRVGAVAFSRSSIPPEGGARIELSAPATTSITVLAPDKKPLAAARVGVESLMVDHVESGVSEDYIRRLAEANNREVKATPSGYLWGRTRIPLPVELSQRAAMTTNEDGVATSHVFALPEASGLKIDTKQYGTQHMTIWEYAPKDGAELKMPKTVTLRPTGRLSGQVIAEDLAAVRGLTLTLSTTDPGVQQGDPSFKGVIRSGSAQVQIDAEGKFEAPALAEGGLAIHLSPDKTTYRIDGSLKKLPNVKAGELAHVKIRLRPGVEVTGIVRERGTKAPIADLFVLVAYGDGNTSENVMTDATGRYTCRVAPGQVYRMPGIPKEYMPLDRTSFVPVAVPENVARCELPTIELTRTPILRGTVVDEKGKPVPGADVQASWYGYNHRLSQADFHEVIRVCDEHGRFAIEGMILRTDDLRGTAKETEARLLARRKDAVVERALMVRGDLSQPVTLTISPSFALALGGKVIDAAGKPVAGAQVKIWHRQLWSLSFRAPTLITFGPETAIRTDSDGKFQTPRQLQRDGEYRAEVEAEGVQKASTPWLKSDDGQGDTFPDLVVNRLFNVTGRIFDRHGQPVANAKITRADEGPQRRQAISDEQGRFHLTNVPDSRGFLFVEANGFRSHGQVLTVGRNPIDAVLTRTTEPVLKPLKTLPEVLTAKERLTVSQRLLEPVLKQTLAKGDDQDKYRVLTALARMDPPRVLEILDKKTFKDESYAQYPRATAATTLAKSSLDEAIAILESMSDPYSRGYSYLELADLLPADKKAKKLELVGQALVQARNVQDASQRAVMLSLVADHLWELHEKDKAKTLIDEAHKLAKNLPTVEWAGYARSVAALSVADVDLPAAVALIKDLRDDGEFDRQHGKMAIRIADRNPAEAERLVGLLKSKSHTYRYMMRPMICFRMAPVDLERARRIADQSSDPYYRPHAYAKMAQALAKSKPAEAAKLLHEAFAQLRNLVESGKDQGNGMHDAAALGAGLLFVAEQIDPELVPEFLWRALALRTGKRHGSHDTGDASHEASLALALARYDRDLARMVLEPWAKRIVALLNTGGYPRRVYEAAHFIDPKWAITLVEEAPDTLKKELVLTQVKLLNMQADERWYHILQTIGIMAEDKDDF